MRAGAEGTVRAAKRVRLRLVPCLIAAVIIQQDPKL
jgi:hypothetical protein